MIKSATFAKVLAQASSPTDAVALMAIRKADEMLRERGRDWHDLVEVGSRLFAAPEPKPQPQDAAQAAHNSGAARAILQTKGYQNFLTENDKVFLQQLIDQPSKHDPVAAQRHISVILKMVHRKRLEAQKAKRAASKGGGPHGVTRKR
jgi:hypothetical protein